MLKIIGYGDTKSLEKFVKYLTLKLPYRTNYNFLVSDIIV